MTATSTPGAPIAAIGMARPRLLLVVLAAILLAGIAALIALSAIDREAWVGELAASVRASTGRELRVDGKVDLGLLPPRLVAHDVSLSNASWGSRPEMLRAGRLEARTTLGALLGGDWRIDVTVLEPEVLLEVAGDGRRNWQFEPELRSRAGESPDTGEGGARPVLPLRRLRMERAQVEFRHAASEQVRTLTVDSLSIAPADEGGTTLSLRAAMDGQPLALDARTEAGLAAIARRSQPLRMRLDASLGASALAGELELRADGPRPMLSGTITSPRIDLRQFRGSTPPPAGSSVPAGATPPASAPATPPPATPPPATSAPAASAPVASAPAPQAPAQSPAPQATPTGAAKPRERLIVDRALPLAALAAFDARLSIRVERLDLHRDLALEQLAATLELTGAKLVMEPITAALAGGRLEAGARLDAARQRGAEPRARLTIAAEGIDLGRIATAVGRDQLLSGGPTELRTELSASGNSTSALVASLDGRVRAVTGAARLHNRRLAAAGDLLTRLIRALDPTTQKTEFTQLRCAVVNAPIRRGIVTVDRNIAAETDKVGVSLVGKVDLVDERLDLALRPTVLEGAGIGLGQLAALIRVEGRLDAPAIRVDERGAAGLVLELGAGIASGGLSVLSKRLLEKATGAEAPCRTALEAR